MIFFFTSVREACIISEVIFNPLYSAGEPHMLHVRVMLVCAVGFLLLSCTELLVHTTPPVHLNVNDKIAVASFENNTTVSSASEKAKTVIAKALSIRGFQKIATSPASKPTYTPFRGKKSAHPYKAQARWGKQVGAKHVVTGIVNEWETLTNLDAPFSVGVTMHLIETESGRIVWTADGSKKGRERGELITSITEELVNAMLVGLSASSPKSKC